MRDYETAVKKLNAQETGNGWHMGICPFHNDHNPSLAFNSDHYICLACGSKGPLANLLDVDTSARVVSTPESDRREKRRTLRTAILRSVAGLLRRALPG